MSPSQPARHRISALWFIAAGLVIGVVGFVTHPGHVSPLVFVVAMVWFVFVGGLVYLKQRRTR